MPDAHRAFRAACLAALVALAVAPAQANDTMAVVPAGGITFVKTADIEMRSEDLHIGRDQIRVRYVFFNHSAHDITTEVAFSLPRFSAGGAQPIEGTPGDNYVAFTVAADGHAVPARLESRAMVDGHNVADVLRQYGIPVVDFGGPGGNPIEQLPVDAKRRLTEADILGPGPDGEFTPQWEVASEFHWRQVFPAKASVTIAHSYKPMAGTDWFGDREAKAIGTAADEFKHYCLAGATRTALGKLLDRQREIGRRENSNTGLRAWEVGYVLTTGANWAGPIQHFRLEIEMPAADNVLGACFPGLRQTGPRMFAAERADFVPTEDLAVAFFENYHWRR
jgi:hypothetical protein